MRDATQADVGKHVIYVDPMGQPKDALITAVWGTRCINLVVVVDDPNATDRYGRKTYKGNTSVVHGVDQPAHGNYWLWSGEEKPVVDGANPLTAE